MNKILRWYMRNETHFFHSTLNGLCALLAVFVLWVFADLWIVQGVACAYVGIKVYGWLQRESYRSMRTEQATRIR